jgi:hypothetical protein
MTSRVLALEIEARLLAPWRAACARVLGHAPQLIDRGDGGPQLHFTADASEMYRKAIADIRVFPGDRVRAHLRRLGYAWDDAGSITTIPTPSSLRARLSNLGLHGGYTPELHRIGSLYMSKRTWLARQIAGAVPVTVGTRAYYAQVDILRRLPSTRHWRDHLRYHLFGVQHDMTRHALMLHLVPAAAVHDLGARVQAAVHAAPGLGVPEPLARFYENDLTGYCQAIWRDLPGPESFAPTFLDPHNLGQLHAALDRRVAATRKNWWHRQRDPDDPAATFTIVQPPVARRGVC